MNQNFDPNNNNVNQNLSPNNMNPNVGPNNNIMPNNNVNQNYYPNNNVNPNGAVNTNDSNQMIHCSRCGSEMKWNARYCMKCGNLNYNNAANDKMKDVMGDEAYNPIVSYQVGAGGAITKIKKAGSSVAIASNTGSSLMCFIVSYISLILSLLVIIIPTISKEISIDSLSSLRFTLPIAIVCVLWFYIYSFECLFMKCNKRWWGALIPIYNFWVLMNLAYQKKRYAILCFVPIIGLLFILGGFYKLGVRFRYKGSLALFFPYIMLPLMGFGGHLYDDCMYISGDQKSIEANYSRKRSFIVTAAVFLVLSTSLFLYNHKNDLKTYARLVANYYYVYSAKAISRKIKSKIKTNFYHCDSNYYNDTGVYYFNYYDLGKSVFLPLYYMRDGIEAYVKVDNSSGTSKYYVSMSDGTYGFEEVDIDELTVRKVTKVSSIEFKTNEDDDVIVCSLGV